MAEDEGPAGVRVRLFGRVRIERDGVELSLPTRKVELLLAHLLLSPGAASREKVAALLWGDSRDTAARASLRNALSQLRRAIDPDLLDADRDTVAISPSFPVWVDAIEFRDRATRYLQDPDARPDRLPLELATGELLAHSYDEWVLRERDAFDVLRRRATLELVQQLRAHGEYATAREHARHALEHDPADERAHQHLMFCHVALGDRAEALRQYETCRAAMQTELGVDPSPATERLRRWIQDAPRQRQPVEASVTNLPIPTTGFVGREEDLAAVRDRLASGRAVTLSGAGGSGKTRLAIQAATDLLDEVDDGVWWVELSALDDGALVASAVATVLGVPEVQDEPVGETLARFVAARDLLLVLDNCEHLVETSAQLTADLLSRAPGLRVLVTSREPLGLDGEHVVRVAGLPTPPPDLDDPDELVEHGAALLFVRRATTLDPSFTLDRQTAGHVARIVAGVEGVPLAIELAAARARSLGVEAVADRLDGALHLLAGARRGAPARHRTLEATVAWSHDLLTEPEAVLFRRLSVFTGGWTLAAAEEVCAGDGLARDDVALLLAQLVDKSLVEAHEQTTARRYRMLETIRMYGVDRLEEAGEVAALRDRHLRHVVRLVEAPEPHVGYLLSDPEVEHWAPRLEAESENVRAAVAWSLDPGPDRSAARVESGVRICSNLHWFWFASGRFAEGHDWMTRLFDRDEAAALPPELRALGLVTRGYVACWQGKFEEGGADLEQARALFAAVGDPSGEALALHGLGFAAVGRGALPEGRTLFEECLGIAERVDDQWLRAFAEHFLGIVLTYLGDVEAASAHFSAATTTLTRLGGHRQGLAFSYFHDARIARLGGDRASARDRLARALGLFREAGDLRGLGYALSGFVVLAAVEGDAPRAARLAGATTSVQAVLGPFLEVPLQVEYEQHLAAVRELLGDEAFERALAVGRDMELPDAIAYAAA